MRSPRLPTDEERTDWHEETRHDQLWGRRPPVLHTQPALPQATGNAVPHPSPRPMPPSPARGQAAVLSPLDPTRISGTDGRTAQRLKRGELPLDATLDLHGMTREQAHQSVSLHLPRWAASGARCVCIITGKGRQGEGVLRRELPLWLNDARLRPYIVTLAPAPRTLGGEGAVLVLLKRMR